MGLLSTMARMIDATSHNYVQFAIPPERAQNIQYNPKPIVPGSGYFRVWAVEIRINQNSWLTTYYPVLHSVVAFDYAGKRVELTRINSLDSLKASTQDNIEMDKVLALNFVLADLVPFNGGTVEISAGLLAMKEKDKVQAAIKIVSDFSTVLVVPQLTAVLSVVRPLANSVEQLIGLGDNQFRLGYHNTFTSSNSGGSNELRPQYIAVIASYLEDNISRTGEGHWVNNDHLCYIDPNPHSVSKIPVDIPRDYILLRLEVRRSRYEEWNNLTDLNEAFMEAMRLLPKGKKKADEQLGIVISKVFTSSDIAENDRDVIAEALQNKYEERAKFYAARPQSLDIEDEAEQVLTLADALDGLAFN